MTVTVTGTNLSSSVDDSGRFELHGVPAGHVELHFSGRSADARLALDNVADREAIQIVVRVNGGTAELEDNHRQTPDNRVELEGIVAAVNAAAGTLTVGTTVVTVPSTAVVRGHDGATLRLSDIRVGDQVEVHATSSGTTTTATEIEVETEHNGDNRGPGNGGDDGNHGGDDGNHGNAEVSGVLAGRAGTCPSLTFSVGSTHVSTSGSTEFKDVTCSALKNGDRVEVKGSRQNDGTIAASRVEKQ
jgi:hypothetical protein